MEIGIAKSTPSDVPALARTLAQAFADDPGLTWAMPDAARRPRNAQRYFGALLTHVYIPKGEVYATTDHSTVAIWGPPGEWQASARATIRMFPTIARSLGRRVPVGLRMLNMMESRHRQVTEPHWYLAFAATRPDRQGRGLGSALVREVLGQCDAHGLPAYLEASAPRNRDLYLRLGFEVLEELNWPGGGPPFWPMLRRPGRGAA